jgi:hypothetical protein
MPILWSSVLGGTEPNMAGGATQNTRIFAVPATGNPFSTAGMAVFYINNAAAFVTTQVTGGALQVTLVPTTSNSGGAPSGATALVGGG